MIACLSRCAYRFSFDSETRGLNGPHHARIEDEDMARSKDTLKRLRLVVLAVVVAGLTNVSAQSNVEGNGDAKRLSLTTQYAKAQRDRGDSGAVSEDEFSVLTTEGDRSTGKQSRGQSKTGSASLMSPNTDFWFYTADVLLFNDHDQDGYYYGIDLLFDADTYYAFAEVYAVVYLSLEGGPWNEYAATANFDIFGASADDEYVIVTELLSGYPSGSYDILIELFDTFDGSFVASFGPIDTSELAFLPLEDADRDTPQSTTIIIDEHGGGSLGWLTLVVLGLAGVGRREK